MRLKLSKIISVNIIKNQLRKRKGLHLTLKTVGGIRMGMEISWMSRINKAVAPSSKDKAKTERETGGKRK
jgi:hypothetical protein